MDPGRVGRAPAPGESGQWTYRNGAFYAGKTASIARDLKLPDVAEIQFDLAWKGALNLAIALYTDSLLPILLTAKDQAPDFGGFYSLRLHNATEALICGRSKNWSLIRQLGQLLYPVPQQQRPAARRSARQQAAAQNRPFPR